MQEMITIAGRMFRVEAVNEGIAAYRLYGPRGARYTAIRKRGNPDEMFVVNSAYRVIDGLWLTDRDGTLRVRV